MKLSRTITAEVETSSFFFFVKADTKIIFERELCYKAPKRPLLVNMNNSMY